MEAVKKIPDAECKDGSRYYEELPNGKRRIIEDGKCVGEYDPNLSSVI